MAAIASEAVAVHPGKYGGEEEKDCVHDAECEGSFQECAILVGVDGEEGAARQEAAINVGAVGVGDEAEVVDTGDEGAHEAYFTHIIWSVNCEGGL